MIPHVPLTLPNSGYLFIQCNAGLTIQFYYFQSTVSNQRIKFVSCDS